MLELENQLEPTGWRKMLLPGLEIYLQPRVTLTFDLLGPKVDRFMSLLCELFVLISIKISSCSKYRLEQFADKQTNRQMNGQSKNITPLPARLGWWKQKNLFCTNKKKQSWELSSEWQIHRLAVWLSGNALASINVVALRQTRLVPGWVTVCGQVNHLGM